MFCVGDFCTLTTANAHILIYHDDGARFLVLQVLVRAPPDESITFTPLLSSPTPEGPHTTPLEQRSSTAQRSPSEVGAQWSTAEEVHSALQVLLGRGGMEEEVSLAAASAMAGTAIADPTTAGTDAATALLAARQGDHVYQQVKQYHGKLTNVDAFILHTKKALTDTGGVCLFRKMYWRLLRVLL